MKQKNFPGNLSENILGLFYLLAKFPFTITEKN